MSRQGFGFNSGGSVVPGATVVVEYPMTCNLPLDGDNTVTHGRAKACLGIASLRDSTGKSINYQDWRNDPTSATTLINNVIINVACDPGTLTNCTLVLLFANA